MSEMVERVAAVIEAQAEQRGIFIVDGEASEIARAAIEAMLTYIREDGEAHGHCSPDTPIQILVKRLSAALTPSTTEQARPPDKPR